MSPLNSSVSREHSLQHRSHSQFTGCGFQVVYIQTADRSEWAFFSLHVFFVCVCCLFLFFLGGCCCCFYRRLRCHRGFYMFLLNTNTTASMCAQHLRLEELVGPARFLVFPASTPTLPVVEENVPVQ